MRHWANLILALTVALAATGCRHRASVAVRPAAPSNAIVRGARDQLSWGTHYYSGYTKIAYPNGDVPRSRGVCTDVVIRAFRAAGYDLQQLVHEDMLQSGANYPVYANLRRPDTNIDHRRCPNLRRFFERHGKKLTINLSPSALREWQPGDVVFWKLFGGKDHVGIVSDVKNQAGVPFVIHNIGEPAEEDRLDGWKIVGHFRYPPQGIDAVKSQSETRA